jgi:hyperosmotically inducible periplasmic protein
VKNPISLLLASATMTISLYAVAQSPSPTQSPANTVLPTPKTTTLPPDDARTNIVDKYNASGTADSQRQDKTDIQLSSRIRKSVMADKSLSTYAHNVKIVSVDGHVTLNGVVRSEEEKNAIDLKAQSIAGKANVTNDIKIAPPAG